MKNAIVIGAGASGLTAAYFAAKNKNVSVTLIEKNDRPARKLMITGKGRCNVTNNCDLRTLLDNVTKNEKFLYSAFSSFSSSDTMELFKTLGVPLKTERGNRVFPVSDKSLDIVDALVNAVKKEKCKILKGTVKEIKAENGIVYEAVLSNGEKINADYIVLATGGISYPLTGSTGDGYKMAQKLGIKVTELLPSLVPFECREGFCSHLSGLTLKNIKLSVFENESKKPVFEELGELLFTHFGISGPLVLSASAKMRKKGASYKAVIDLKPALTPEMLDARILRDFSSEPNLNFSNSLSKLVPKSLIPVIIKLSHIDGKTKLNQISKKERQDLCLILKNLTLHVEGLRPIEEAIITSGGIDVKEINPRTMQSKKFENLYFCGEIIDVDALTGGFNLQIAFSTGYLAGKSISENGE